MAKYMKEGDQISGTDITITKAPSSKTNFLSSFIGGLQSGAGAEAKMKKEKDKLTYYTELREAGYSAEEATARVNKQFSGTFLDRALGRDPAGFEKPSQDNFVAKNEKTKAEIAALKAKASRDNRYVGAAKKDGEAASVQTARADQISNAIYETKSALRTEKDPEKKKKLETKLSLYQKALDKFMLGSGGSSSDAAGPYVPGETEEGDEFTGPDGKTYRVLDATDPEDPDIEEV